MRNFAISAYRSEHHRWWFSPHPPSPANTRQTTPRFSILLLRLKRDECRPFQKYAELLNEISPEEWRLQRLDQIHHKLSRPNVQLQDLAEPLYNNPICPSITIYQQLMAAMMMNVVYDD